MKTRTALPMSVLLILLSLTLGVQPVKSQNAPAATASSDSMKLTGSTLREEDLVAKSDAIFIGEIADPGLTVPTSPGMASYSGVQVKVLQVLRGSVDPQVTVKLDIFATNHEGPPQVGSSYIFFVHKENDQLRVLKLLPTTNANTTKVTKVIAAAPASK
jgi:hypothetical protein